MSPWLFLVIVIVGLAAYGVWLRKKWRRNRLNSSAKDRAVRRLAQLSTLQDPHRRVLEADAILEATLTDLGYTGTMADKLKKAGRYIPGLNDVWRAHKLRNRIAHEPGTIVAERDIDEAVLALKRAVEKFCRSLP